MGSTGPAVAVNYELNAPETLTAFKITMQGDPGQEASIGAGTTCEFQSYTNSPPSGNPISPLNPFVCLANVQGVPAFPGLRSGAINLLGPSNSLLVSVPFAETGSAAAAWIVPNVASALVSSLVAAQAVAVSGQNGTVYIADQGNGNAGTAKVYSWNGLTGTAPTPVTIPGITLYQPIDVALDGAGDLFIADYGSGGQAEPSLPDQLGKIVVVPANNAIAPYILATGSVLYHPTSLAFDSNGNLYIGDGGPLGYGDLTTPGFVAKVPPAGGPISKLNTGAANVIYPQSLVTDSAGNLYIADGGSLTVGQGQVVLIPANGSAPSVVNIPGLLNTGALAIDPAGQLWVLDDGNLHQFTIVPPNGGTPYTVPLVANFVLPTKMVFTAGSNNVLVSDGVTNIIAQVSGLQAQLTFPTTAVTTPPTQSPSQTAAILSIGNSALKPANQGGNLYSISGNTQDFQVQNSSTCLSFAQLLPTQSCAFSTTFAPVTPGTESESITSIFNSANQVRLVLAGVTPNASSVTAPPTLSPVSGTYAFAQSITMSDTTSGAVIYYTTDNSVPTANSAVYHSPILVTLRPGFRSR